MSVQLRAWGIGRLPNIVVETRGYWIKQEDTDYLLDTQLGNAAYTLGYGNTEISNAVKEQIENISFVRSNRGETFELAENMGNLICNTGDWSVYSWAETGTSAVEAAITMSDSYWLIAGLKKDLIISFSPSYHGSSWLTKSMSTPMMWKSERSIMCPFPAWKNVEERDDAESRCLDHLENTIELCNGRVGVIIMESVPWITGYTVTSSQWWKNIRKLCDEHNILMITDDVAMCWGKNGYYHSWKEFGVQPDISTLGKGLSAGYSSLAAAVANDKIKDAINDLQWKHGHTHNPNPIGIAAMKAAHDIILRDKLFDKVGIIKQNMKNIAENFLKSRHILSYRQHGVMTSFDYSKDMCDNDFFSAGLTSPLGHSSSLNVISPLIADDIYFDQMEKRLLKVFA